MIKIQKHFRNEKKIFLKKNRILSEYAKNGDLSQLIKKFQFQKKSIPEALIWFVFVIVFFLLYDIYYL